MSKGDYVGLNKKPRNRSVENGKVELNENTQGVKYVALAEMMRLTGISRQTFYNLNKKKLLPFRHLGKLVVIDPKEFNELVDSPAFAGMHIGGGASVRLGKKQHRPLKLTLSK